MLVEKSVRSNLEFLVTSLRKTMEIGNVTLYGKSLGGFVVTQNAHFADNVIIDRTFSNISEINRFDCAR